MTEPRTYSSPAGRTDRRTEFIAFYEGTYSAVTGEVLALTGDLDIAQTLARASYARTWQAWPAVRSLDWPVMWVRADAVRRTRRPPRGDRLLQHGLPTLAEVALDPEDEVLVASLQCLPMEHRLPLVLHYLGHVPIETITEWFGDPTDELEVRLDAGFDALVAILDWPDDADDADEQDEDADDADQGDAYGWTAEALESCAQRFRDTFPVPPPALVFRRATVKKVTRRGVPITAAAAAAAIGLVVYLSPAPHSTAQAAGYAVPPSPVAAAGTPADLDTVTAETTPADTTTAETTAPAGTTTKSAVRRATTKKTVSEGNAVAGVPVLAVSSSPATPTSTTPTSTTPTSTTPTSTTPTSTTPTSTTPTTTAGSTGGETGGGTVSGELAGSGSTDTGSTGSSVVTTTDSTTPDTTTGTDETNSEETTSATTTPRNDDQEDCPPTTTETTDTTTTETTTTDPGIETTTTDPGTIETTTTETQPVVLSLVDETNTTTATAGTGTNRSARSATAQASE